MRVLVAEDDPKLLKTLLHIFRSLTNDQQEFYLEQGQIFLRQNRKKESSFLPPVQNNSRVVS